MAKYRNLKVKIVSDEKLAGEIGSSLLIRGLINHVYDFRSNPRDKKKPGSDAVTAVFQKPTLPGLWRTQDRLGDYSTHPGPRQWLRPGGGKLGRHLRVQLAQLES